MAHLHPRFITYKLARRVFENGHSRASRSLTLPIHDGLHYLRLERRHTLPPKRHRVFLRLIPLFTAG